MISLLNKSELDTKKDSKYKWLKIVWKNWHQDTFMGFIWKTEVIIWLTNGGIMIFWKPVADELHGHGFKTRKES